MAQKPFKRDANDNVIPAGTEISGVLNVSISAASFAAVTLGSVSCKAIFVTTRDGADWLLSDILAGTTYATLPSGIGIDIAGGEGQTLFFAKGTSTTTLEVILLN